MIRALALCLLLAACTSNGDVSNPIVRKLSWFSYVEGDDLRDACAAATPGRYRLIYNGNYAEQRRLYDLAEGTPGRLAVRVIQGGGLGTWSVTEPFAPWSGATADRELTPDSVATVVAGIAQAGGFGPPAEGLELESASYFWTLAACHQGRYHFTAWRADPPPAFAAPLLALDATGIPVNPPRPREHLFRDNDPRPDFSLRVGRNGLWGVP